MTPVRKRRVFYVSGFDPRGVSAYHRMFCEESRKQGAWSGIEVETGARRRESPVSSVWTARRETGSGTVETTFEFVHWDDIARRHWHTGIRNLYRLAFKTYWHWIIASDFLLRRIFRASRWNFLTGLAPAIVLFLLPPLGLLAGWGGHAIAAMIPGAPAWLPYAGGIGGFFGVLGLAWWLERFFSLAWLLRTYGFVVDHSRGKVPALDERMDRFAARIVEYAASSDDDEILVVGHSVGANVAVSTMARALKLDSGLCSSGRPVSLLTLGGSIPMQGLMPWSTAFRDDLKFVAHAQALPWVDVSARQDVASFALLNPVQAAGVELDDETARRPLVVSGQFRQMLSPETYATASWDMFRMHFQYLMASERPKENDYLAITTDSVAFTDRFRDVKDERRR